jgi:hypothetical protein
MPRRKKQRNFNGFLLPYSHSFYPVQNSISPVPLPPTLCHPFSTEVFHYPQNHLQQPNPVLPSVFPHAGLVFPLPTPLSNFVGTPIFLTAPILNGTFACSAYSVSPGVTPGHGVPVFKVCFFPVVKLICH